MEKIDFKVVLKHLYQFSEEEAHRVEVPTLNYLMIDGEGDPNSSKEYKEAVEALFSLSYALKFKIKKSEAAIDYTVMPLEGLWWADDMSEFSVERKSDWKWTMMIMQPDSVSQEMVEAVLSDIKKKKSLNALNKIRFEAFSEGVCAQLLHLGPFTEEGPSIGKVHDFIDASRCEKTGKHHEIYLSDIRRADPAKWRTILRQPMR